MNNVVESIYSSATKLGLDVPGLIATGLSIDPQRMRFGLDEEEMYKHLRRGILSILGGFSLAALFGIIHNSTEPREIVTLKSPALWAGAVLFASVSFSLVDGINTSELGVDLAD